MELVPAALLVGLGGVGLYVLGKTAVEQRAITKAGHRKTDPEDDPRVTEDLVAWTVAMVTLGVVFQGTPAMIDQALAWKASLTAGRLP